MKLKYFNELKKTMEYISKNKKVIFLGQAVTYPGTAMFNTLKDISPQQKIELPVAEEMQMGITLGMALKGYIPISVYPRWNFLLSATNQLVNHLDKIKEISDNQFNPKIIIRTSVGSIRPLHPQCQHIGDFSDFFMGICKNINIIKLNKPSEIFKSYNKAISGKNKINLIVEIADYYNEK